MLKVYLAVVFLGNGKSESLAKSEKSILSLELELALELIASNRVLQGEDAGLDIDIGLSSIEWLIFFEFFALEILWSTFLKRSLGALATSANATTIFIFWFSLNNEIG